jgi:hypothetical protein
LKIWSCEFNYWIETIKDSFHSFGSPESLGS